MFGTDGVRGLGWTRNAESPDFPGENRWFPGSLG